MADETGAPIRMQQDAATAKTLLSSALLGELNRRVLDYENSIDWMTSCTGCANLLDRSVEEMFRREQAEVKLAEVRTYCWDRYRAYSDAGTRQTLAGIMAIIGIEEETDHG